MPVGYSQLNELYQVLLRHLSRSQAEALLKDLAETAAYRTNASFRETVDRLSAGLQIEARALHNAGSAKRRKE